MRARLTRSAWLGVLVTAGTAVAADDVATTLRDLRWRVDQVTVDCSGQPCPEVQVWERPQPGLGAVEGPRLSLGGTAPGLVGERRVRLALRMLREMVHRVEARRQQGTGWLLEDDPAPSKGMDGTHRPVDLVRMLERLLRPAALGEGTAAHDEGLRRLLGALAGQRPWSEDPSLARALHEMAARVGPAGNLEGAAP